MGVEKFNAKPHHDNPNHAGRHSHEMRMQAADYELESYLNGEYDEPQELVEGQETILFNRIRHQENLSRLHGYFYKGTYYHHGVGQKNERTRSERKTK